MVKIQSFLRNKNVFVFAILAFIAGLAYLPFAGQIGYFNDDWYLMYSAGAKGASVFSDIFGIDRPGRVLVMMPAYGLFGQNPLYYNLSAYAFRVISAWGFYWLLDMLWPRQRGASASMALLFLVYPGFLSQTNAIDYQSHIAGLAAATVSIACTVKAVLSENKINKLFFFSIAIVLGWFYLWQMEWYIGFEFLRWGSVFVLMSRAGKTLFQKVWRTFSSAYVTILVPAVFLFWRLVMFTPERGATDVSIQLDQIIQSPLKTSLRWLSTLLTDTLDVVVLAWWQPAKSLWPWISTRNMLFIGLGLGTVAVVSTLVLLKQIESPESSGGGDWKQEAFWLGLSSVLFGLVPIVMVNRSVDFVFYSRYTLVSSAGAAILLGSLIFSLKQPSLQKMIMAALIFLTSLTHFSNGYKAAQITQATRDFWWQVSWRIPQLETHTTLVANYAVGFSEEDYFVWGPANLIYYPKSFREEYVQPGVFAALLNQDTIDKTLANKGQEYDNRRTIRTYKNYRRLLVLTQPTVNSCVHLIDGSQPEYSRHENASIQVIGSYSSFEHVLKNEPAHTPPPIVFGPEPEHDWCYYYQAASLARQRGRWEDVDWLWEESQERGFAPIDLIELMPFIQAYAELGNDVHLKELAEMVTTDAYVAAQACQFMQEWNQTGSNIPEGILSLYCIEAE